MQILEDRQHDDAFDGLVNEHRAAILAHARRLTGDTGVAEDVVQETLVRAWQHQHQLDANRGSVRGWLLTVLRNIVIDQARARARRPLEQTMPERAGDASVLARHAVCSPHDERIVTADVVRQLMLRLSPGHREALVQVYLVGRTTTEAADVMGVAVGTVRSRCHYALRALRTDVESGLVDLGDDHAGWSPPAAA